MIAFSALKPSAGIDVYVISEDGSGLRSLSAQFTAGRSGWVTANAPLWSHNGGQLMFTVFRRSIPAAQIYVADLSGGQVRPVSGGGEDVWAGEWLPDGRIVCNTTTSSGREWGILSSDGTHRLVLASYGEYKELSVSPDGRQAAVLRQDDSSLAIVDLADMQPRIVLPGIKGRRDGLRWSPDGKGIAFRENRERVHQSLKEQLYAVRPDGSGLETLGKVVTESDFSWSPDGRRIAGISPHYRAHKSVFDIDLIEIDPPSQSPVVEIHREPESGDFAPTAPAWSPDGTRLLYSTFGREHCTLNVIDLGNGAVNCLVSEEAALDRIHSLRWGK